MTIGLTYDDTLYRVQMALSGLNSAVSAVKVERSFNQLLWSTVRGGTALPVSGGSGSLDDYEYAVSADGSLTTFYRVTTADPAPGVVLDGSSGSYASTPDAASLDITGDLDLRAEVSLDDWVPASDQMVIAKWDDPGSQKSFRFGVNGGDGVLFFSWSTDGAAEVVRGSGVAPTIPESGRLAIRVTFDVDNGSGGADITFYTAPSLGGPWTQLGSVVSVGVQSVFAGTAVLEVGSQNDGTGLLMSGSVHAAEVRDGIDGTVVADPDFTAEASGTTSFDDDAGLTWTINGGAEIVTLQTNSIVVTVDPCEVTLKSIRFPLLNRQVTISEYTDLERPGDTGVFPVTGRSFPIATTDVNTSVRFAMDFVTDTADEARRLKLLLALGDILYLQVPAAGDPQLPPRSMYLVPDSAAVARLGTGAMRGTSVPFTEVAAPSPLVAGSTLVWQTVFDTFGSWESLISAVPTWADLLATVSDPGDAVVF